MLRAFFQTLFRKKQFEQELDERTRRLPRTDHRRKRSPRNVASSRAPKSARGSWRHGAGQRGRPRGPHRESRSISS